MTIFDCRNSAVTEIEKDHAICERGVLAVPTRSHPGNGHLRSALALLPLCISFLDFVSVWRIINISVYTIYNTVECTDAYKCNRLLVWIYIGAKELECDFVLYASMHGYSIFGVYMGHGGVASTRTIFVVQRQIEIKPRPNPHARTFNSLKYDRNQIIRSTEHRFIPEASCEGGWNDALGSFCCRMSFSVFK